jgi:hypothetical protein
VLRNSEIFFLRYLLAIMIVFDTFEERVVGYFASQNKSKYVNLSYRKFGIPMLLLSQKDCDERLILLFFK